MSCKTVSERMYCSMFGDACLLHGVFDCSLDCGVADMMSADNAGPWVNREHHRQLRPPLGPNSSIKIAQIFIKDIAEQKEKRIKCLVLSRGRNPLLKRKM